ncbi:MAG: HEAT repeat domain-containing protein [Planctomycetota bacterium]
MKMQVFAAGVITGSLLLMTAGELSGHGGVYRGPGDTVPPGNGDGPGTRGPGGPPITPGGPGNGPGTPGAGGGPITPGGPGGGLGGNPGPGRGGRAGTSRGGGKRTRGEGFEQWQFWWEYNKDRFLDLRSRLGSAAVVSGRGGFLNGPGRREVASTSDRPTSVQIEGTILPVLESVLTDPDPDLVDSAVLAMARMIRKDDPSAPRVLERIHAVLQNSNPTVKQSAVLSLGVLGCSAAIPTLIDVMNDTPAGRKALKANGSIQIMQRAFAAFSLGMIGEPETIGTLFQAIESSSKTEPDLCSAAILALGQFQVGREQIVPFLTKYLDDRGLQGAVRAQIPITLGRLGDAALPAIPGLIRELRSKKSDLNVRESCVIALGRLALPEDREVFDVLCEIIQDGNNPQERHFAFIALAQIGGRAAAQDPSIHSATLDRLSDFLLKQLTRPKRQAHQPWAALALAVLGREYEPGSKVRVMVGVKLQEAFEESSNNSYKAGMAIAMGLLNVTAAAPTLYSELQDTSDTSLQGYLAEAIGMLRYSKASATLRTLLLDPRDPRRQLQVATALGLMGDAEASTLLMGALEDAKTLGVITSLARALGLIGDRGSVGGLLRKISDERATGLARGFACVAVGLIGEKTDLPWNEPFSENANYRTVIPSLMEVLDIL